MLKVLTPLSPEAIPSSLRHFRCALFVEIHITSPEISTPLASKAVLAVYLKSFTMAPAKGSPWSDQEKVCSLLSPHDHSRSSVASRRIIPSDSNDNLISDRAPPLHDPSLRRLSSMEDPSDPPRPHLGLYTDDVLRSRQEQLGYQNGQWWGCCAGYG